MFGTADDHIRFSSAEACTGEAGVRVNEHPSRTAETIAAATRTSMPRDEFREMKRPKERGKQGTRERD